MTCTEKKDFNIDFSNDEQKVMTMEEHDALILEKVWLIKEEENKISYDETVYLITWCPNPDDLPNADFNLQHRYNVNFLSEFLSVVRCGLLCVESSQIGNPHYHGWYQKEPSKELLRIAFMKTFERLGRLKITKARKIKKNTYHQRVNGLYYYKKEVLDEMLKVPLNPVSRGMRDDFNWTSCYFFTKDIKTTNVLDRISDRQFYLQFYKDSR